MSANRETAALVKAAAHAIRERSPLEPRFGLTLGTGLGGLAEEIDTACSIPYADIPGFPETTVVSHQGALILGHLGGQPVAALDGRFHFYEGYTLEQITLPVRVMKALGVEVVIFSNAAGGLNPQHHQGDIMLISDHINLMGVNPLVGPNDETLGPRFPDMCDPYDLDLLAKLEAIALEHGIRTQRGVYVALPGPCLETRAEYRFLRTIGADAVGMSTVPEVIVAVHAGLRIVGLSCLTDMCFPDSLKPVDIDDILRTAAAAGPKMSLLVTRLLERWSGAE